VATRANTIKQLENPLLIMLNVVYYWFGQPFQNEDKFIR
jgi:hypothetical protein